VGGRESDRENSENTMDDILNYRVPQRAVDSIDVYEHMKETNPVVSTTDIADQFDVSHVTARKRLRELVEGGYVGNQKLHESTEAWYLTERLV